MSFFSPSKIALPPLRTSGFPGPTFAITGAGPGPTFAITGAGGLRTTLIIAIVLLGAAMPAPAADEPEQSNFHYDAEGRRDPFRPLIFDGRMVGVIGEPSTPDATDQPVLYGILWDPGGNSIALINDAEAKVGDTVNGYQVTEIRHDAVVVTNGGEPVVLQIAFETPPSGTTKGGQRQ